MNNYNWQNERIAHSFKTQGLDKLKNFRYRDDMLAIRTAVFQFVKQYFSNYYAQDSIVANDYEIQNFAQQVAAITPGFPNSFKTLELLVDTVTDMIVLTSVKHHAMNSKTEWNGRYFPAFPHALYKPLPKTKTGPLDLRSFIDTNPGRLLGAISQTSIFHIDTPKNYWLGYSYKDYNLGSKAGPAVEKLIAALEKIAKAIERREATKQRKYFSLHPKNLAAISYV
jgi:hypothetical protein